LRPRGESTYKYEFGTATMTPVADRNTSSLETISFYQGASYLYEHGLYRALSPDEFTRYTQLGEGLSGQTKAVVVNP
jgi:hypothetical protein